MRLDFNETNILVQAMSDLEKQPGSPVSKDALLNFLYTLHGNTNEAYPFIRNSIKSLILKIESVSDKDIEKIRDDKNNNRIIATTCYTLPGYP